MQVPKERLDAMAAELAAARQGTELLQLEVARLKQQLARVEAEKEESRRHEAQAKECIGDLRVRWEVAPAC